MNRSRLLMISLLALAFGGLAALFVYKNLPQKGAAEAGTEVVVAADDVQVGTKLSERDVRLARIPASDLPPGYYAKLSQVLGHGAIMPISKGEFVLPTKLAPEDAGAGLPSLITRGMRAVSVRVNDVVAVAGFVTPGTRVDVLLTGTPTGGSESQTTTVLQNIRVIAVGHTLERSSTGEPQNAPVITLLVTPEDAQKLTLASSQGHIQLALRNPLDTRQDDVAAASSRQLYRGGAPEPPPTSAPAHVRTVKRKAEQSAPAPTVLSVEVYQGDKKAEVKNFNEDGSEVK
ncbi:MAG TPA: Flp pilus assembly protein CpaB [Candidatus Sulfotelmatobacter sp.]|nr:Flp pilus assembly protein CpaB [Candidatus Sulfotelmatobacter sp.]